MRRRGLAAVAIALAAVAVTAGTAQGNPGKRTITLYEHDTQQASIDLGDPGPSLGDQFLFAGDVFDHRGGTRLGTARDVCTTVSGTATHPGDVACTATVTLGGGQIVLQGLADSTALFSGVTLPVAIEGGTGNYRYATGEGTAQVPPDVPNQTDLNLVITVRSAT